MGFVFGYQNQQQFFLFDWKQGDQLSGSALAEAGMTVKLVNADSPLTRMDLWNTDGNGDRVQTLFHNDIPWENFTDYEFDLVFHPGQFTITVSQGDMVLESITLHDDTYTSGGFGFYNYSQGLVTYSGFTRQAVPELTYRYDSDALDPDLDAVSYSLLEAPDGMEIIPTTGQVTWAPTVEQLEAADEPAVDPTLPVVPGFAVEDYAEVPDAMNLTFDSTGTIYAGRDMAFSGGGALDPAKIHRIAPGGSPVREYGETAIGDPDSVLFDADGTVSGQPGSVLVGGYSGGGYIRAILPDESIQVVFGPSAVLGNVEMMTFDRSGRLVFVNNRVDGNFEIFTSDGEFPSLLFSESSLVGGIGIDSHNRIFTSTADKRIAIHEADGTLVDEAFYVGQGPLQIGFGRGGLWGDSLYAIDSGLGELLRINEEGMAETIGTGFDPVRMEFGPDGALYISDYTNDRILRIAPDRASQGLAGNEHQVTIAASDGRGGADQQTFVVRVVPVDGNHPPVIVSEPVTEIILAPTADLADTITFESVLGETPSDGMEINTQFLESHGVSFRLEGGGSPVLAQVGSPLTAFAGYESRDDEPAPDQHVGSFFLTDDGVAGPNPETVIVDYADPVSGAGGVILDIDGAEQWTVEARDAGGQVIDTLILGPDDPPGPGNALAFPWSFSHPVADIHSLRFVYTGTNVIVGLAFDNFTANSAGQEYRYDVDAVDPDDDELTYTFESGPEGMFVDETTGLVRWPVTSADVGSHQMSVRASDRRGGADVQTFTIEILSPGTGEIHGTKFDDANQDGVRTVADETGLQEWTIYLDQNQNDRRDTGERWTLTDENGDYSFTGLPEGTYDVAEEQQPGWTQTMPDTGAYTVSLSDDEIQTGIDFGNAIADTTGNLPPKFTSTAPTEVDPDELLRYEAVAVDPNRDPLTFDLVLKPNGMTVHPDRGVVVWQPTLDQVGTHQVVLRVRDGRGGVDLQSFDIVVVPPNSAPEITSTPVETAVAELPYVYQVSAQDAEGEVVTFSLDGTPPDGMDIDPDTGRLTWTPTVDQVTIHDVTIVASDGELESSQTFTLEVLADAPNDPPQITSTPRARTRLGSEYVYVIEATDPNADPLSYHLDSSPPGMTIDDDGVVRWQPTAGQLGDNSVNVRVEDGRGGIDTQKLHSHRRHFRHQHSPLGNLQPADHRSRRPHLQIRPQSPRRRRRSGRLEPRSGTARNVDRSSARHAPLDTHRRADRARRRGRPRARRLLCQQYAVVHDQCPLQQPAPGDHFGRSHEGLARRTLRLPRPGNRSRRRSA